MYKLTEYEREKIGNAEFSDHLEQLIDGLNVAKEKYLEVNEFNNLVGKNYDNFHVKKVSPKFIYLDYGGSGCFLVERKTGELYNIKGYGVADYNKHAKAPLGNVSTVDPLWLYAKRYNYLRG